MSAASPKTPEKGQEPSMEEILASIRRIIADDQNAKAEVVSPVRSTPPLPENDDVLDLAEVAQPRKPQPAPMEEAGDRLRRERTDRLRLDFLRRRRARTGALAAAGGTSARAAPCRPPP